MAAPGIKKIEELKRRFQNIPIESIMAKIAKRNKATIEDANIKQMDAGKNVFGTDIEPEYSPFTVKLKKAMGQTFDHVTLKNKGDFHEGTEANILSNGIEMVNKDSKWGKITDKYGKVIGLNDDAKQEVIDEVFRPELPEEVKEYLQHG